MQLSAQVPITPELDRDPFIERQPNQVEGLGYN